jgi:hypothetical protein
VAALLTGTEKQPVNTAALRGDLLPLTVRLTPASNNPGSRVAIEQARDKAQAQVAARGTKRVAAGSKGREPEREPGIAAVAVAIKSAIDKFRAAVPEEILERLVVPPAVEAGARRERAARAGLPAWEAVAEAEVAVVVAEAEVVVAAAGGGGSEP